MIIRKKFRSLTYLPQMLFVATVLTACGGGGGGSSSTSPSNIAPLAADDAATVNEGTSANINLAANDTDADDGLNLTSIAILAAPTNGGVVVNANGTVDYTHNGSETLSGSFSYKISDVSGATSNTATVNITVTPMNDAPVANNDVATLNEGASTNINLAANDADADDGLDLTSIAILAAPANGSVVVNANGTVDYTHNAGEVANDSFTYTISDVSGATSNTATVNITVTPVNDVPVANDDSVTLGRGGIANIDLAANDTDVDDGLDLDSIVIIAGPTNGTIDSINADGTVDYTHDGSAIPSDDSFTYFIKDMSGAPSNIVTVNLTVRERFNEALYATPTVSSASSTARQFQANDGSSPDAGNGWMINPADAGPHKIRLTFDSPKMIYRVTLSDLLDLNDNITSATIDFSNGDSIPVAALPINGAAQEFVFASKLVDWIEVTLNTANTINFGLSEFGAFSVLDPGQSTVMTELFNDSDAAIAARWPVTNECGKGTPTWSGLDGVAAVNNEYVQTGDCRGFSLEGVELGSYPVLGGFTIKDMDLRLRFKSGGTGVTWVNGALGVLFAYRPSDYYRLDISQAEGHIKLWKKVAGVFTELATSPQSYATDTSYPWMNLRIVRQNGVILVYIDSVKAMAIEDNEPSLNNSPYQIALLCARNESCSFENLTVLTPPGNPVVGANIVDVAGHTSGEYYVDTAGSLAVTAVVTDDASITEVEFVVDEGQGGEVSSIDSGGAPYTATFGLLAAGEHTVRTYLRDGSGRLSSAEAMEELPTVGVSGIHLVGLGDSITGGLFDDVPGDDRSTDGRNTSGGYQPVLNDRLTDANTTPVTVLNEGNPGETSAEGAARIGAVLARTPAAQGYLALYGANDSSVGSPTPSGLGLVPGNLGYPGSFKDNMQQIIDAVTAAGKVTILGKTLPHKGNATRNTQIIEFNTVIGELILANGLGPAPDFYTYFFNNTGEMADDLHPNGAGYNSMADGWCKHLNGQSLPVTGVITCTEASPFPN